MALLEAPELPLTDLYGVMPHIRAIPGAQIHSLAKERGGVSTTEKMGDYYLKSGRMPSTRSADKETEVGKEVIFTVIK